MENYYNNSENEYARNDSASNIEPQVTSNQPVKQKKKGSGKVGRFFGRLALLIVSGLVFGLCAAAAFGIVNYYAPKGDDKEAAAESFDMETYKTQIERDIINRINREKDRSGDEDSVIGTISSSGEVHAVVTDVTDVVEKVMPSVVSIKNSYTATANFWGQEYSEEAEASGSGIIIGENDTELLIATNNHVIDDADKLSVKFIDGEEADANVKGADADMDIAVIAVQKDSLKGSTKDAIAIAELGDSDELKVGEPAIAIGNALGYGQSVTTGVISALDRELEVEAGEFSQGFIQTDAAINPGNSGGALLNVKGQVIGINSNKIGGSAVEGMGYAIPISKALPIIDNLKTKKTKAAVSEDNRGYLGISGRGVSSEMSEIYGFPEGVYVYEVYEGTGAESAGLRKGDVITKLEGTTIKSMENLQENLAYYEEGETVEITIERSDESGEYQSQTVELELVGRDKLPSE
ncbi:MAG: trypsin-like peptidase domain-containing protein [Lachnospiraceae bacterium]|nr:trypsin-like peptidase domain-containing protein [Lachnospiraceae bacterium]